MTTWRKCAACSGRCHWEEQAWVCSECGTMWTAQYHPRYGSPDIKARPMILIPACHWCYESRDATAEVMTSQGFTTFMCAECTVATGAQVVANLTEWGRSEPWLTAGQIREYVNGQSWVYAKTMPQYPHEYVLLHRSTDPWTHLRLVGFIREFGVLRRWGRRYHSYWSLDDHEYWSMRLQDTILNRQSKGKEES